MEEPEEIEILRPPSSSTTQGTPPPVDPLQSFTTNRLVKLEPTQEQFRSLRRSFLACFGHAAEETSVVAIHKDWVYRPARLATFKKFELAIKEKNNNDSNTARAFFLCANAEEASRFLTYGFTGIGAGGLRLVAPYSLLRSLPQIEADEHGLRHVLCCRVILGRAEVVQQGASLHHPSTPDFHSAVLFGSTQLPNAYLMYECFANIHVSRDYAITFRVPPTQQLCGHILGSPLGYYPPAQLKLVELVHHLLKCLRPSDCPQVKAWLSDFQNGNITGVELFTRLQQVIGEALVIGIIKEYQDAVIG